MADNKKMILNLFAGMQDALFLGDRFSNGEFVSFLQPGQFISQNLKENSDSDDMAIQSEIANVLIDTSYVNKYKDINYSNGTELLGSVNQVYFDILNQSALPYKALTPAQLAEISNLQSWLASNLSNYELYRDQYYDIVDAYETERLKQIPNGAILRRLAQKKTDAFSNWETFGQKRMNDIKLGRFIYLTSENPTTYWLRLNQKMQDHLNRAPNAGDYYQTFLVPSVSSWANAGWSTFERQISERDSYQYSKSTAWSGGLSGGWGLWSFGGGTSGSTNYKRDVSTVETVNLKFEYLRVRIFRPWLTPDVLRYKFWTWKKTFGGQYISDGGNIQNTPPLRPIGRMPVLPQYLILVRNVEISAAFSQEEKDFYSREMQANASVGWGPFSVSGSYREAETTQHFKASFDGVTFKIAQPQIIARSSIMVPKSPDPNRSLEWQDDACFPSDDCFSTETKNIEQIRETDYFNLTEEEENIDIFSEAEKIKNIWAEDRLKNKKK